MKLLLGFAYITVKENARRRSFYGLLVAYLLSLGFSRALMEFSLQDLTKVFLDFSYSFLSFFLFVSILFITTDIMSKDLDKKGVYIVLSKGISKETYILGRAFSFLVFSFLIAFTMGFLFLIGTKLINYFTPTAFRKEIQILAGFTVVLFLWIKAFLLSTVILFLSSFMGNFFLIFLTAVVVLIAGSAVENLYKFVILEGDRISPLVSSLVTFIFYTFPNFSSPGPDPLMDMSRLKSSYLILDFIRAVIYSLFLVFLSSLLFKRRQIP